MPKISVNTKIEAINLISNKGTELEIDQDTLLRWNNAISEWWKVQLEMDKYLQAKAVDEIFK